MALQVGSRIRDYVIDTLIGSGGMGEVYLATDVNLNRKVAIKVLRPEFTHDQTFAQRFRNEAQVQAQLNHPRIVALYSFFDEGGSYYIVLEYAAGITLDKLMQQIGIIPEERAFRIFNQIAEALSYAHKQKVVHRDIKPSNIMVDINNGDAVKVMDFGIARMMDAGHITRTGAQMGSVHYMSPEQVMAERDVDHRSDIFSAGIVLYEMLSGRLPYDVDTLSPYKVQEQIIHRPLPDPRQVYEYISPSTVTLLEWLTRKDRTQRPSDIMQVLQTQPAKPIPQRPAAQATPRREVMETKLKIDDPRQQQALAQPAYNGVPDSQTPRRKSTWPWFLVAVVIVAIGAVIFFLPRKDPSASNVEEAAMAAPAHMVLVEGGSFTMGSTQGADDEYPPHQVNLSPFYISTTEVTQAQWEAVMGWNRSQFRGPNQPVESVSWLQAVEYCNLRSKAEGLQACYTGSGNAIQCDFSADGYRLPTEAEWEYAAGGGALQQSYLYAGSNNIGSVAWYEGNSNSPQEVAMKQANSLGLFDMTGNVREWCWDWYYDGYYGQDGVTDPKGASSSDKGRQTRGGSYKSDAFRSRVKFRAYGNASEPRTGEYGLRVVRTKQIGI